MHVIYDVWPSKHYLQIPSDSRLLCCLNDNNLGHVNLWPKRHAAAKRGLRVRAALCQWVLQNYFYIHLRLEPTLNSQKINSNLTKAENGYVIQKINYKRRLLNWNTNEKDCCKTWYPCFHSWTKKWVSKAVFELQNVHLNNMYTAPSQPHIFAHYSILNFLLEFPFVCYLLLID